MRARTLARAASTAAVLLAIGCGGGGGGGTEKTTVNLAGSYDYQLTPGSVTGSGASDCDPTTAESGTATVVWTTGSNVCTITVGSWDPITAKVNGNSATYSVSSPGDWNCDTYQESWKVSWSSDDDATGTMTWVCGWTTSGVQYSCTQTNALSITRKP